MRYLQKLGMSLMLPVATLPIAGLLMGLGYFLSPATMQGGEIEGFIPLVGLFLVKAGGAVIMNMALLFAIGVGVGLSDKNDGTGALAAIVSWFMMTTLLASDFVQIIMPSIASNSDSILAFDRIQNPFIGIIAGIIGALSYNRFKDTHLPNWLGFFSGKRSVAIIASLISILVSVILLFIWPVLFTALISLGQGIAKMGAIGAGLYAFLNKLLIPFGLHHAINNVFWFDTIGLGDLTHFWAGETSADVSWSLGMYMAGFFPSMMFGIPGACLAMVHTAKTKKKKIVTGLLGSAALCAFAVGITEPFEFAFLFAAPALYAVYAVLNGFFMWLSAIVGFRAGFAFSAGVTDLVFSSSLPAAANTWMILPLGLAAFVIYYLVFRFMITSFKLKTPGREDDLEEDVIELSQAKEKNDYTQMAEQILEALGGPDNVLTATNCATRLRLELEDLSKVDETKIKTSGALATIKTGKHNLQVIVGTHVQFVTDEFKRLMTK